MKNQLKLTKKQRHNAYLKSYEIRHDHYNLCSFLQSGLCILFRAGMGKTKSDFAFDETANYLPELNLFLKEIEACNLPKNKLNKVREFIILLCVELTR